ncbi:hypothetical protein [Phyllobacterium phragmitis]|uniref:hypothetical protein n=1 Tax=Phyllobacterium phragmitis TaxID=2670329 RepID=UPI0011B280C2|nr:hypothetical protein [Phyllobacterium phragmitis]
MPGFLLGAWLLKRYLPLLANAFRVNSAPNFVSIQQQFFAMDRVERRAGGFAHFPPQTRSTRKRRGHDKHKNAGPAGRYAAISRRGAGMDTLAISKENPLFQPGPAWIVRISARAKIAGRGVVPYHSRTLAENTDHVFSSGSPVRLTSTGQPKCCPLA